LRVRRWRPRWHWRRTARSRFCSGQWRLHQSGDPEKAIPLYREFLKLQPDAAQIHSNLGAALASTGRYEEAIAEYRQALKGLPGDPRVRLNMSLSLYKSGQISEAAKELAAVHVSQPNNRQVTQLLADCWLRQGLNAKVIDLLTPVEAADRTDMAVAYMLGTALLQEKNLEKGQQIIDRILRNGDSAEARFLMATAKLERHGFHRRDRGSAEGGGIEPQPARRQLLPWRSA
jgi:predicted Zn-dependent protease